MHCCAQTNSCPSGQKSHPQAHETNEKTVQQVWVPCCAAPAF